MNMWVKRIRHDDLVYELGRIFELDRRLWQVAGMRAHAVPWTRVKRWKPWTWRRVGVLWRIELDCEPISRYVGFRGPIRAFVPAYVVYDRTSIGHVKRALREAPPPVARGRSWIARLWLWVVILSALGLIVGVAAGCAPPAEPIKPITIPVVIGDPQPALSRALKHNEIDAWKLLMTDSEAAEAAKGR